MKVATWNVNSLRVRIELVRKWLTANRPEIVCLQETKVPDESFPADAFLELGYHLQHWGSSAYNGVALASLYDLENPRLGFDAPAYDGVVEPRCVSATIKGVRVYSIYAPNGRSLDHPHYQYKLSWFAKLSDSVRKDLETSPVIVAGDFNVAPADLDVYDPKALEGATHVSQPEREVVKNLEALGLVDVVRTINQTEPSFTWWDYRQGAFRRDMGMRIDLVLASKQLADGAKYYVDKDMRKSPRPSDHAPLVVELKWPGE
jgi:exodeoxyribonuclease-3